LAATTSLTALALLRLSAASLALVAALVGWLGPATASCCVLAAASSCPVFFFLGLATAVFFSGVATLEKLISTGVKK